MPTGYTATLMEKGQSFPDFVMLCARAMGATIMLRDEPLDAPIPEFKPSDYNAKELAKAKKELTQLLALSDAERIKFGARAKAKIVKQFQDWIAKNEAEDARLNEMGKLVAAWKPPTSEHEGMKAFMMDQIKISLNGNSYETKGLIEAEAKCDLSYYDEAVADTRRSIEYNIKSDAEERERTANCNEWVRQLRASLSIR